MVCKWYLAMTDEELRLTGKTSGIARMGCGFSGSQPALEGLPARMPADHLLIIDDRHPISRHRKDKVIRQLVACQSDGILLDLQKPRTAASAAMVKAIAQNLSCPVAVTAPYADLTQGPVLVVASLHIPLQRLIAPWKHRKIWLDIPFGLQTVTGAEAGPITPFTGEAFPQYDKFLHCAYKTRRTDQGLQFTLYRSRQMLPQLLAQAGELGVEKAIGLYKEYYQTK